MTQNIRTYSELIKLPTFKERFNYLKLDGNVGIETFGFNRYLNQSLYGKSQEWKRTRNGIILRDNGCDLGIPDRQIFGRIIIHHMNPLTEEDLLNRNPDIFNPEFLIATTIDTHNAIHYGDDSFIFEGPIIRTQNDTIPWR